MIFADKSTISCLLIVGTPSTFSGHCETSWRTVGSSALQSPLSWWWRRDAGWQISHFTIVWTQSSCPQQTSSSNMVLSASATFMFFGQQAKCIFLSMYYALRSTRLRRQQRAQPRVKYQVWCWWSDILWWIRTRRGLQSTANQQHLEPLKSPHKTFIVHETFHHWLILL